MLVRNQRFKRFNGTYRGSTKVPDFAFLATNNEGDREPKFVLEVGLGDVYSATIVRIKAQDGDKSRLGWQR